jgi:hypothetical protein
VSGGSSFAVVVLSCAIAAPAFAQDQPAAPPAGAPPAAPAEPAATPPPATPVAQQSAPQSMVLDKPGVDFGVRLGYALPFGNTGGTEKLSDGLSGAVPIVLEAGYRINGNFTVGALFQYGLAQIKNNSTTMCGGAVSCSGSVVRLGIEGIYNFNLDTALSPWVGVGTGYEWLNISLSSGGQSASASTKGLEFLTLHGGADYHVSPQLALGPFVSFSLGEYSTTSVDMGGNSTSADVTDKKLHEWLQLGVRGKFGI